MSAVVGRLAAALAVLLFACAPASALVGSTTTVASSINPSASGQSITLTATVVETLTGLPIATSGNVTIKDGATTLGTGTTNASGQFSVTTSALSAGAHSITAVYAGNIVYNGSTSSTLTQNVNTTSTTSVISSVNPSALTQFVTFTATVSGSGGTPTGTVTFKDGSTTLGTGTLSSGMATFSTSLLLPGSHSITAVYGGDSTFAASTSSTLSQTVNLGTSSTSVVSSTNPSASGQSVTFTATVGGLGATPTGTVTFKDGGSTIGTGSLNGSGQASMSTSSLTVGSHSITAEYAGDSLYGASTSSALSQTVSQNSSSTAVVSSVNPSALTQSVTFTATVSGSGGTPSGTVTFMDGATTLGTGTLSSGSTTFSTSALLPGSHSITAVYGGDSNFAGSTSSALSQTVNIGTSSTSVTSSLNPSASGQSVTFTATVTGLIVTPTGTVTFKDGGSTIGTGTLNGSGQATLSTSALSTGSHSITAVYGGDTLYNSSTSSALSQSVNANNSSTSVVSSVNPSALTQSVTFTATVSGSGVTPTGTVTFMDGVTTLGTGTLSGGTATFSTALLLPGSHSITAVYGGDSSFAGSTSSSLTQTVNIGTSSTSVASSLNPSASGQSVTFTATVTGLVVTPTGTVTFKDGATTLGTSTLNGSGQATLSTSGLSTGSHSITAVYGGDSLYNSSTSSALTQTVSANSSSTSLTSSVNPSALTQSVTFTATVSGSGGTPTGTVTFKDGSTTLGTGTLSGGTATFSTALLLPGSHSITAVYGGDTNFASSTSSSLSQTVNVGTSSTSVASSLNPSASGQSVTFTATVTGLVVTPTGTVTFKDGATTLGTGTLNGGGQATLSTSALTTGSHSITAVYGGDSLYNSSTSSALTQTVTANSSSTSLASSVNPSALTQSVTFTATVSGSGGTPTGTVTFKDGSTTLGTGTLSGGTATFSTALLLPGSHSITAVYGGDTNFSSSTSSALTQTVNIGTSSTSVVSSLNPSASGQSVTFTATVTGLVVVPTGTVTFKDGASTLGTGTLNGSGQATLSTGALTTGSHSITAVYGGDALYNSSTSSALSQTVTANSSSTSLTSSINPSALTQSVTFTATVSGSGGTPTGTVTFKDGSTTLGTGTLSGGTATFSTALLLPGGHSITAVYGGDTNFSASTSSPVSQTIGIGASSTTLTSSVNPSAAGQSVTFTATVSGLVVTPTGTVTFKDGTTTLGTGTLNGSGQATFSTAALTSGAHAITAVYGGNTVYAGSTSPPLTQNVGAGSSTVALTSSRISSAAGQVVIFVATVTTSGAPATGTVTFKDGATTLATVPLNGSGQATFSSTALAAGSHAITAIYNGDGSTSGSTSPALTQVVTINSSTVTLSSSVNPSVPGQSVTFTATVSGANGTPGGIVVFKDGAATLGSATLANGRATLSTSTLATGSHAITAIYAGDSAFTAASSAALTQTVAVPADSTNLRTLQSAASKVVAQSSGIAIAGAIDNAIAEVFSGVTQALTPSASGLRASLIAFAEEPRTTGSIASQASEAFRSVAPKLAADQKLFEQEMRRWMPWTEFRAAAWNSSRSTDMQGNQINALAGLTHVLREDVIVGAFGGYETFDYRWASILGQMKGQGFTAGGYAGWRFQPNLRLEAGLAYSWINYDATAGTATAKMNGERWLLSLGLVGTHKFEGLTLEPSARVYFLRESDRGYVDSLGTAQPERQLAAGRASAGIKASYAYKISPTLTVTPFAGIFADYVFSQDIGTVGSVDHSTDWSARITGGVSFTTASGIRTALSAEIGGLGSPLTMWLVRCGVTVPF